jgi:hypothetical protein
VDDEPGFVGSTELVASIPSVFLADEVVEMTNDAHADLQRRIDEVSTGLQAKLTGAMVASAVLRRRASTRWRLAEARQFGADSRRIAIVYGQPGNGNAFRRRVGWVPRFVRANDDSHHTNLYELQWVARISAPIVGELNVWGLLPHKALASRPNLPE